MSADAYYLDDDDEFEDYDDEESYELIADALAEELAELEEERGRELTDVEAFVIATRAYEDGLPMSEVYDDLHEAIGTAPPDQSEPLPLDASESERHAHMAARLAPPPREDPGELSADATEAERQAWMSQKLQAGAEAAKAPPPDEYDDDWSNLDAEYEYEGEAA